VVIIARVWVRSVPYWAKAFLGVGSVPWSRHETRGLDMLSKRLKKSWKELKQGRPGKRFQERAEKSRRSRSNRSWVARILEPTIGVVLLVGGVILCVMPGPGLPLLILGATLVAERSLTAARALDWCELKARKIIAWGKDWWRHASLIARVAMVVLAAGILAGAGYGAYYIGFEL
jgi:hypothetical protein